MNTTADMDSLLKLVGSGNVREVEETWLGWLGDDFSSRDWTQRAAILDTLVQADKISEAQTLAGTALESFSESAEPREALGPAGAFLKILKNCDELRQPVGDLYRKAHADLQGLDALLDDAGIYGGRPPRRAIRTLEVCTCVKEGSFLAHRHEPCAARVKAIDYNTWRVTIEGEDGEETLSPTELADNFAVTDKNNFHVMRQFDQSRLVEALQDDPAGVVIGILRGRGDRIDSDELQRTLVPHHVAQREWTKWWTKARSGLRLSPNVIIEGRAPYFLTYNLAGQSYEEEIEAKLAKLDDPAAELSVVDEYVRGCKPRKQQPDAKLLRKVRSRIEDRAHRVLQRGGKPDLTPWLASHHIAELVGESDSLQPIVEILSQSSDPAAAILAVDTPEFWPAACAAVEQARPANLPDVLERLLPYAPAAVADHIAEKLIELGASRERFGEVAERILREPLKMFAGLVWLWNEPGPEQARVNVPLVTVLTRMIHALAELEHDDTISSQHKKHVRAGARDTIRARRYQRFQQMLDRIEPGMASALRTEINRSDGLGRAASEDMLRLLHDKFPDLAVKAVTLPRWLRDDVLYVTEQGKRVKQGELEEMVNVKIRQNAEAIGRAAALGDLSENSEYKFALEERDLLQARLAQMQREMDICQVLLPGDVPTNHVGIGCRIVLEHAQQGTRREITILGPWEAKPKNRVYNYQTPLAQAVLGAHQGDTTNVEFFDPPGEYRVIEISNALAERAAAQ